MMDSFPERVGVIGGGRMGGGIAHAFLTSGSSVVVVERDAASAGPARDRVVRDVAASVERGRLEGPVERWADRLTVATGLDALTGCDLVIEAVIEDHATKVSVLRGAEAVLGASAWLATNTSSLSVDALARELQHPERFVGLHFFNPVPASKLIEVVIGARTGDELTALTRSWVEALGKAPVVVRDAPGFATTRLGVVVALEAMRMVEQEVASAADIDRGMELGYKWPVGPLALTDIVGLDVRLGIAESLHRELGERFAPPQILRELVARGHLGRKSGQGFYTYDQEGSL